MDERIKKIVKEVKESLFTRGMDDFWTDPRAYRLGKYKHFHEVRKAVEPYGIRLDFIEGTVVFSDTPWRFTHEGADDPTGYSRFIKEI